MSDLECVYEYLTPSLWSSHAWRFGHCANPSIPWLDVDCKFSPRVYNSTAGADVKVPWPRSDCLCFGGGGPTEKSMLYPLIILLLDQIWLEYKNKLNAFAYITTSLIQVSSHIPPKDVPTTQQPAQDKKAHFTIEIPIRLGKRITTITSQSSYWRQIDGCIRAISQHKYSISY